MKIKKEIPSTYLDEYDVRVNKYLTYADIQNIVNSTLELEKSKQDDNIVADSWASRNQNIDMVLLICATDISVEELEKTSHATLLKSGLIDAVKNAIENYNRVEEAFKYTESWDKTLIYGLQLLAKKMESKDFMKKLKEVLNGESNKSNG